MNTEKRIIFTNARIYTADDKNPSADSMIVESGRITWIGFHADMPSSEGGTVVDLNIHIHSP